jgi:hypothetical protein
MILEIATKLQASAKDEVGNGHENFGRCSFVICSFFLQLLPSIGSDNRLNGYVMADSYLGGAR